MSDSLKNAGVLIMEEEKQRLQLYPLFVQIQKLNVNTCSFMLLSETTFTNFHIQSSRRYFPSYKMWSVIGNYSCQSPI